MVARLFGPHRRDLTRQREHVTTRVVVAEPVERDVDVQAHDVEVLRRRPRRARVADRRRRGSGRRDDRLGERRQRRQQREHTGDTEPPAGRRHAGSHHHQRGSTRGAQQETETGGKASGEGDERVPTDVAPALRMTMGVLVQVVVHAEEAMVRHRADAEGERGGTGDGNRQTDAFAGVRRCSSEHHDGHRRQHDERHGERRVAQEVDGERRLARLCHTGAVVDEHEPERADVGQQASEGDRERCRDARGPIHVATFPRVWRVRSRARDAQPCLWSCRSLGSTGTVGSPCATCGSPLPCPIENTTAPLPGSAYRRNRSPAESLAT